MNKFHNMEQVYPDPCQLTHQSNIIEIAYEVTSYTDLHLQIFHNNNEININIYVEWDKWACMAWWRVSSDI